jgi:hypothetical protein
MGSSLEPSKGMLLAESLLLVLWDSYLVLNLQNYKIVNLICLKTTSSWQSVIPSIGK